LWIYHELSQLVCVDRICSHGYCIVKNRTIVNGLSELQLMSINYGGPKPKMTKSIGGSMVCMVACAYVDIHNINNMSCYVTWFVVGHYWFIPCKKNGCFVIDSMISLIACPKSLSRRIPWSAYCVSKTLIIVLATKK
jgi:hypothetical protein